MKTENYQYQEKIFLFLKGELSVEAENELLNWIKKDNRKKDLFLNELELLRGKLIQTENKQVDLQWKKLKIRLQDHAMPLAASDKKKTLLYAKAFAIAAAFVLGLIISSVFYYINSQRFSGERFVQNVTIPYGAKTSFKLPDGSLVWLNSGSKLSFPSEYDGERTVKLEGEAFFEVVKNKQPFIVSTGFGDVEVLGTKFDVKAYVDDEFQTTLVEGSVRIMQESNKSVVLKPDQQAYMDERNRLAVQQVDTELYTSWKDGRLIFYREPFEKVAKRFERWYNVNIEIDNEEMKDLWFTGTIEMETFSEVMDLISKSLPITYSYNQTTRTLKINKK